MIKVRINPLNHIQYASFYIYALQQMFGTKGVAFDSTPFRDLSLEAQTSRGLLFTFTESDGAETKYYICGNDSYRIEEEIYEWCDVYASVNANKAKTPDRDKLVSLAPSFAIRTGGTGSIIRMAISNSIPYLKASHGHKLKTFIGNYKRLLNRPYYTDMIPEKSRNDYIFFCSTLWYNDEWNRNDETVNARRANFIRACKGINGIEFDGGFVAQKGRSSVDLFKDCLAEKSYPYSEWREKTQRSALVFNTPAFWDCHGWKLGEYLALGKAIISSPLSNDLPAPLEHGKNIHFVEDCNTESLSEAIRYILVHPDYRKQLELGAKEYWEEYGTPEKSLEIIGI